MSKKTKNPEIEIEKKTKNPKIKIPATLRNTVWNTYIGIDKKQSICFCCNSEQITFGNFECGHVHAESKKGEMTIQNLRPICGLCNKSMSTTNMEDFIEKCGFIKTKNWNGINNESSISINNNNALVNIIDTIIKCEYCYKIFARKNALYKHKKESCKVAIQQKEEKEKSNKVAILEEKNKHLDQLIKTKNKEIEENIKNNEKIFVKLQTLEAKNKQYEQEIKNKDREFEQITNQLEQKNKQLEQEIKNKDRKLEKKKKNKEKIIETIIEKKVTQLVKDLLSDELNNNRLIMINK